MRTYDKLIATIPLCRNPGQVRPLSGPSLHRPLCMPFSMPLFMRPRTAKR